MKNVTVITVSITLTIKYYTYNPVKRHTLNVNVISAMRVTALVDVINHTNYHIKERGDWAPLNESHFKSYNSL